MICASRSVPSVAADGLGLTAGEQRRAVGLGQHADLAGDRAHGACVAAVDARLAGEDALAHDVLLDFLK
jgi:hypothetical protein